MKYKIILTSLIILTIAIGAGYFIYKSSPNSTYVPPIVPQPITSLPTNQASFDIPLLLKIGEVKTFSDGLSIKLKEINDSRCPANVQCIWQGELSALILVQNGALGSLENEIRLGTVSNTGSNSSIKMKNYIFTLNTATENSVTVSVSKSEIPVAIGACYVGGCSSQLCSDQKDMMSTCEYTQKYACYQTAKCERQSSGKCGWTETPTLTSCLNQADSQHQVY